MLQAGLFTSFKSANSLLLWGEKGDIKRLYADLRRLHDGETPLLTVAGCSEDSVLSIVASTEHDGITSDLASAKGALRWTCSRQVIEDLRALIIGLLDGEGAGHQYIDLSGPLADQIVLSMGEDPSSLRP